MEKSKTRKAMLECCPEEGEKEKLESLIDDLESSLLGIISAFSITSIDDLDAIPSAVEDLKDIIEGLY